MIRRIIEEYTLNEPGRKHEQRMAEKNQSVEIRTTVFTGLIPCTWYLAVTLAVPFLNGAPEKTGGRFYDHAAMVLGFCVITWIVITSLIFCGRGLRLLFKGGYRKHEAPNPDY